MTLTYYVLLFPLLMLSNGIALAQERALDGGLGYKFSMTVKEAKASGFTDASDESNVMRFVKVKTIDMFDSHLLFYTAMTNKLWMIQGVKSYGRNSTGDTPKCTSDATLLSDAIAKKYPQLVSFSKGGPGINTASYCEAAKPATPSLMVGQHRCIEITCTADGILAIDYVDYDLTSQMRTELDTWRRENAASELKKRGLDPRTL